MTTTERPIAPALIALAGALSLAAAMGIGRFAFTPMLPLMLHEGLLNAAQGGWAAAANYAGYLVGALTAARMPLPVGALAMLALLATAALTAAMASPLVAIWLPLRFLAGVASAWVFVATSVWCLGALADHGTRRATGWVYAGVGTGIAVVGVHCLLAAAAGVRSAFLWMQLGGLALLLAMPVFGGHRTPTARYGHGGIGYRGRQFARRRPRHARPRRLLRRHGLRLHPARNVPSRACPQRRG